MSSLDQFDEEWFSLCVNEEQNPTMGSVTLLSRVRSMAETWKKLHVSTSAFYQPGQLSLFADICDFTARSVDGASSITGSQIARLRVDHFGTSISTGWVSCSSEYWWYHTLENSQDGRKIPVESSESLTGIDEAIDWLVAQLRRPIQRLEWSRDNKTVAILWILADTGRKLSAAGSPALMGKLMRNLQTATSVFQVRP